MRLQDVAAGCGCNGAASKVSGAGGAWQARHARPLQHGQLLPPCQDARALAVAWRAHGARLAMVAPAAAPHRALGGPRSVLRVWVSPGARAVQTRAPACSGWWRGGAGMGPIVRRVCAQEAVAFAPALVRTRAVSVTVDNFLVANAKLGEDQMHAVAEWAVVVEVERVARLLTRQPRRRDARNASQSNTGV